MRLQPPGKRSQPPATAAQLRLVIPLYLANSCTLGPTPLLLQPCLRPVLGRSWGGREGRPRFPPTPRPCLPHTHHTSEQSHHPASSAACQHLPAAGKASGWLRRGPSSQATVQGPPPPAVGDAEPGSRALLGKKQIYENTLIISSKQLRNKVVLFCFYNPSKKKKQKQKPSSH